MVGIIEGTPWLAGVIVFVTQLIFLYLRTLNVMYTAENRVWLAIITGQGIGITCLISISIGATAIMQLQMLPILGFLTGGALGTWLGFKQRKFKNNERIKY
tara:strand:+ start:6149 stop:6451 length:303 start_codon:yes stop_codon:yes gene_type:complete